MVEAGGWGAGSAFIFSVAWPRVPPADGLTALDGDADS